MKRRALRSRRTAHPAPCAAGSSPASRRPAPDSPARCGRHCPSSAAAVPSARPILLQPLRQAPRPSVPRAARSLRRYRPSPTVPPQCRCTPDARCPAPRRKLPAPAPSSAAMAMMQVDVPTTFTTSPSRQPAPIASQCASNAPTGIGMPARSPIFSAHSAQDGRQACPTSRYSPAILSRIPSNSGSTSTETPAAAARPTSDSTSTCDPSRRRCASPSRIGDRRTASPPPCRSVQAQSQTARASPDCAAANAAAWQIPIRANRPRRTSQSLQDSRDARAR